MIKTLIILILTTSCCVKKECPPGYEFHCPDKCVKIESYQLVPTDPITTKISEIEVELPKFTKYTVSDKVCVWGKWTGVITSLSLSKGVPLGHDPVVVYTVQYLDGEDFKSDDFYETELTTGECR